MSISRMVPLCLVLFIHLPERIEATTRNLNMSGEYTLKKVLFDDHHDAEIRPVSKDEISIQVRFEIALHQILNINAKDESILLSAFSRTYWHDKYLTWNPKDYSNITEINTSSEKLWVPDITLQNSIDRSDTISGNLGKVTKKLIVNSKGHVKWFGNVIFASSCSMNVRYFPFDVQECTLIFTSWAYHGKQLDLTPNRIKVDLDAFSTHTEWELESAVQKKFIKKYNCCNELYPEIHVTMRLKRRPLFYVMNLILPMVMITFLTLISFYVPSKSGERISYGVTLLLAMTLFMLLLADMIPAASDNISLMGVFFTCVIIEMVLMVLTLCYISRMYLKTAEEGRIHPWMKRFLFDYLAPKLGVRGSRCHIVNGDSTKKLNYDIIVGESTAGQIPIQSDDSVLTKVAFDLNNEAHIFNDGTAIDEKKEEIETNNQPSKFDCMAFSVRTNNNETDEAVSRKKSDGNNRREFYFEDIVTKVMKQDNKILNDRYQAEKEEKLCLEEWRICAETMDRLALIVFSAIFLCIAIMIVVQ